MIDDAKTKALEKYKELLGGSVDWDGTQDHAFLSAWDAALKHAEKELMQEIGYYPSYYLKSPVDIKINSIKVMFKRLREQENKTK